MTFKFRYIVIILVLWALAAILISQGQAQSFNDYQHKEELKSLQIATGGFGAGNNLTGFWQKKTSSVAPSISFVDGTVDSADLTTYTFTNHATGTAGSTRSTIVVACGWDSGGIDFSISSMTVGGVSATEVADSANASSDTQCATYIISNPSGTTATIVVTFSEAIGYAYVSVWAAYDLTILAKYDRASVWDTDGGVVTGGDVDVTANGIAVGVCFMDDDSITNFDWTGLTNRGNDEAFSGGGSIMWGDTVQTSAQTPLTVSCDTTGNTADTILQVVSFSNTAAPALSMHRATCVTDTANATTYNSAGFQAITPTGIVNGDVVTVYTVILSEDNATTFGVSSASVDGAAMVEVVDEDGTGVVNSAIFRSNGTITTDGTLNISVTHSEALTGSATVCVWAFKNLESATPSSSVADDDTASGALVLTTGTTVSGGFVIGGCIAAGAASTATWAVLSERDDTNNAEASYSSADGNATGSSMSNTCDYTNTDDASGSAVAVF